MKVLSNIQFIFLFLLLLALSGCTPVQPYNTENICSIYREYPDWFKDTVRAEERWGVPIYVQMAIIDQESSFDGTAKPPRERLLGIIPWSRPTTAYGYSQSTVSTWWLYERDRGAYGADRGSFASAADFIGWYSALAHREAGVPLNNAYELYLAYHEGIQGYRERTYWRKPWLIRVAHKVAYRALVYQHQLWHCLRRA